MENRAQGKTPVLGLMSGTSLDGLDLALCEFESHGNGCSFSIRKAHTINYSPGWKARLAGAKDLTALRYFELNAEYGKFIAGEVNAFLSNSEIKPTALASHGHTVFHQPSSGFSTQVGCGATIAALTGITTICDFRSLDVANGGQGAPLVPIGDQLLFGQYEACLNIGGIANISFDKAAGHRVAHDVCEANMLLNFLAEKSGKAFDEGGALARSGTVNAELLQKLNNLSYYSQTGARSIGREWFENSVQPLMETSGLKTNDLLATSTEHIAQIIAQELTAHQLKNVLVTGGGAYNTLLVEKIRSKTECEVILPDTKTIDFKEALIFAFLGYLRIHNAVNTLGSVTGAHTDSIGGAVYLGKINS